MERVHRTGCLTEQPRVLCTAARRRRRRRPAHCRSCVGPSLPCPGGTTVAVGQPACDTTHRFIRQSSFYICSSSSPHRANNEPPSASEDDDDDDPTTALSANAAWGVGIRCAAARADRQPSRAKGEPETIVDARML